MVPISELPIRTFEEMLLTEEEREAKRIEKEKDKEEADYYRRVFEDPESYFVIRQDDEIPDDDDYLWDEETETENL